MSRIIIDILLIMFGGSLGVMFMCIFQLGKLADEELALKETEEEK